MLFKLLILFRGVEDLLLVDTFAVDVIFSVVVAIEEFIVVEVVVFCNVTDGVVVTGVVGENDTAFAVVIVITEGCVLVVDG